MFRIFAPSQFALLAMIALLPGCADWERHAQESLPTPQAAYVDKQITVSPTRSLHAVSYASGKVQMSDDEKAYLAAFLYDTVRDHEHTVMVEQPGRRADRLTRQRSAALVQWMSNNGYHVHPFPEAESVPGQVQVAVDHLIAQAPNCPNWDWHPNFAFGAQQLPNQGCADHSNLAAMVANPRDLVSGAVPSAPSGHAALRGDVNYRNGAITPLQDAGDIVGAQ